jgi:glutathione S-transferase
VTVVLRLYGNEASPFVARVRVQMAFKSLDVELLPPPGGIGSAQLRQLNPLGRVPVLEFGGTLIPESSVIQEYLEDRFPSPALRGRTAEEAAVVRLVSRVADLYLVPALQPLRAELMARRSSAGASADTAVTAGLEALRAPVQALGVALDQLESCLARGRYAAGATFSLADCTLLPLFVHVDRLTRTLLPEFRRESWPRLDACLRRGAEEPAAAGVLRSMEVAIGASTSRSSSGAHT